MSNIRQYMNLWSLKYGQVDSSKLCNPTCLACETVQSNLSAGEYAQIDISPKFTVQIWEMTQDSYVDKAIQETAMPTDYPGYKKMAFEKYRQDHRNAVTQAMRDGMIVPIEVLEDYPELLTHGATAVKPDIVNLITLIKGDRFIVEGMKLLREVIRREGYKVVVRNMTSNEIEELPTNLKVIKVGHRPDGPPPVCEGMPPETRREMIDTSVESTFKTTVFNDQVVRTPREMGSVITDDYTLGNIKTSAHDDKIDIPRKVDKGQIIGTYHTHPRGNVVPGDFDLIDMLSHNDKLQCICSTGEETGTKCQCYTPHEPIFQQMRLELNNLAADIRDYNKKIGAKYGLRGKSLRKLLRSVGGEAYMRGELPYMVDKLERKSGEPTVISKRQVTGTRTITIEDKKEANKLMISSAQSADNAETKYLVEQDKIDKINDQIMQITETLNSLKGNAIGDGRYITMYNINRVNNLGEMEEIKNEITKSGSVYQITSPIYHYYNFGSDILYSSINDQIQAVGAEINSLNTQIATINTKISDLPGESDERNILESQTRDIRERLGYLYQRRNEQYTERYGAKPTSVEYNVDTTLITTGNSPFDQNDAANELMILMDKDVALAVVNSRIGAINYNNAQLKGEYDRIDHNIQSLVGKAIPYVGMVGGRAEQYRILARNSKLSSRERLQATQQLDELDKQAKQLRPIRQRAKNAILLSQTSQPDTVVVVYGPEIQELMSEIMRLSGQIKDVQPIVDAKLNEAERTRKWANEKRAEFYIMAKDRVVVFNDAVLDVRNGQRLEDRRLAFLNKLRGYEMHARLRPDELRDKAYKLFDSCRLIWEQPTLSFDEREDFMDIERMIGDLISTRKIKVKSTGEFGTVETVKKGIYTVKVGDNLMTLTSDQMEFMD